MRSVFETTVAVVIAALGALGLLLAICAAVFPPRRLDDTIGAFRNNSFTLLTVSQDARTRQLRSWVQHYSQCRSVKEILIVWNRGDPPKVQNWRSNVPVRLRVESRNSLLNRFQIDAGLTTQEVLSLDDDVFMTCNDIEKGFAAWQASPAQLTGFHPRWLEGEPLLYRGEQHAKQAGKFNVVLTTSAFMNASRLFPLIMADNLAPLRVMVDSLTNCEDLLMNFVVANLTRSSPLPYAQAVPVSWRVHTRRLFHGGISSNEREHFRRRTQCLATFSQWFGGSPLRSHVLPAC